ncbi:MAG: acyltransferase family protein [Tepidiformaceae bacterium]
MRDESPAGRLWRVDALKGVAIVLVVVMHAYFGAPAWAGTGERRVMEALYFVGHLVVPIFFVASGYLFGRERRADGESLRRKALTVIVPATTWAVIAVAVRVREFGLTGEQAAIDFAVFNTSGQYFYVFVLGLFFVSAMQLRRADTGLLTVVAVVSMAAGLVRVAMLSAQPPEGSLGAVMAYRDPFLWFGYFALGLRVARGPLALGVAGRTALGIIAAGALAWWFASGEGETSYFSLPIYVAGVCLALLVAEQVTLAATVEPAWARPATFLGRHSFAILLAHMPLFIGLVTERWYPEAFADSYIGRIAFRAAVGLGGPVLLVLAVRAVMPASASKWFGFEGREATPVRRAPQGHIPVAGR